MYLQDMFGLDGKVAIVTGGGRGIGQVIACGLAKAGAEVVILCRSGAKETVELIEREGGKAYDLKTDVTDEAQVDHALQTILERSGSIDVLFNNAGICMHQSTLEATVEEFRQVVDVNLTGEFIMARAVGRIMIERGIKGSIINMASMSGSIVNIPQWQCSYNASKAAVIHMTKSLAVEWAEHGIRVNSLSPGYIATPMAVDVPKELKDAWMPLIPLHRMGTPEELIPPILYLASDASGYTTGSDIIVDGAYSCQ
ncbi:SDR family oxidoreductase [Lachnospiraceae bacterium KGMB03038]|nr:SDR family oxidoreductase [Lachnospiraceae bacterium KGMB03038]